MGRSKKGLEKLKKEMELTTPVLHYLASEFQQEMQRGLEGSESSLKMLPSYLGIPDGREKGSFLALDFGGTNVRVFLTDLYGNGEYKIRKRESFPLQNSKAGYNFTCTAASSEDLFSFIARKIKSLAGEQNEYFLGHTFSFPCKSDGLNHAVLIKWTKEIETFGAEGKDVSGILSEALRREGVLNVIPKAIINDTVGTLLSGAYQGKNCEIGSILGTGHNTCYLEKNNPWSSKSMIINMESGNFNRAPVTKHDLVLDESSEKPGTQLLEKMVAGKYLGELVRFILLDFIEQGMIFEKCGTKGLLMENAFTTEDISLILDDTTLDLSCVEKYLIRTIMAGPSSFSDRQVLREICAIVVSRSACLVASSYLGILRHIDPDLSRKHVIAVDGSLYEKMPDYARILEGKLMELLGERNNQVSLKLTKDGSGVGAAIAAAMAC